MQKKAELYRGKTKTLYSTENPDLLIMEFLNKITAEDGMRTENFNRKGMINNKFNYFIMTKLAESGIKTHLETLLSDSESVVKKLDMTLIEYIIRNRSAGSLVRRLGIQEGIELRPPLLELFLKNDLMHDPMINDSYCETFSLVKTNDLFEIKTLIYQINYILKNLFDSIGFILVDFKLEFGLFKNQIILGDEFSLDGSRVWDKKTLNKMDKDRFRQNLGKIIETYEVVMHRFGIKLD